MYNNGRLITIILLTLHPMIMEHRFWQHVPMASCQSLIYVMSTKISATTRVVVPSRLYCPILIQIGIQRRINNHSTKKNHHISRSKSNQRHGKVMAIHNLTIKKTNYSPAHSSNSIPNYSVGHKRGYFHYSPKIFGVMYPIVILAIHSQLTPY